MTIFGSYLGKDRSLLGESLHITYVLCLPVYCNCGFREYYILFNGQKRLEPWKSCYSQHGGNDPSFSAGSIWLQHFVRNTAAWSRNEHHGLEDFIVSNNILPLGSVVFVGSACPNRLGWKRFIKEAVRMKMAE